MVSAWERAYGTRGERHAVRGGNHYLHGQPDLVAQVADTIAELMHAFEQAAEGLDRIRRS